MPTLVQVNDVALEGTITEVLPNIENDVIRFTVALSEPSHRLLRPNLRVDVLVVTDRRAGPSRSNWGRLAMVPARMARQRRSSFGAITLCVSQYDSDCVALTK